MEPTKDLALTILLGVFLGILLGFFLGVYSTEAGKDLMGVVSEQPREEQPADILNQNEISREGFSLKFPGNWKIDTGDVDYDPDGWFLIESPGYCFAEFSMLNESLNTSAVTQALILSYSEQLTEVSEITNLTDWGGYGGNGFTLKGKRVMNDVEIKLFSYSSDKKSFFVTEFCYDDDLEMVGPGFQLIESTFKLN